MSELLDKARAAGLTVLLNGRIGREEYHSVSGSVGALQRLVDSYYPPAGTDVNLIERLRNRAALQIDDNDAFIMREAARALARQHYVNLANEAQLAAAAPPN